MSKRIYDVNQTTVSKRGMAMQYLAIVVADNEEEAIQMTTRSRVHLIIDDITHLECVAFPGTVDGFHLKGTPLDESRVLIEYRGGRGWHDR